MNPAGSEEFAKPWLLLCEGQSDKRFFERLFEVHGIGANFHVRVPQKDGQDNGGRTNFGDDLAFITVAESFIANVQAVLIVSDNDSDPAASFQEVREQIAKADVLPVPTAEREPAKAKGSPTVVVLMLPIEQRGNLETLCLISAYGKWALKEALDAFQDSTPARDWEIGKQSKMRLQCLLAATNKKQPDAGFASSWKQSEKYQIPVDHDCFRSLIEFLRDFDRVIA